MSGRVTRFSFSRAALASAALVASISAGASAFEEPLDPTTCTGQWNPFLNLSGFGEETGGEVDQWFQKVWPPQVCQGGTNEGNECTADAQCPGSTCGEWCLPAAYRAAVDPQYWCGYGAARYHNEQDDDGDGISDAFGDPSDDIEIEDFFPARLYRIHSDPGAKIQARQPVGPACTPAPISDTLVYVVFPKQVPDVPPADPLPAPRVFMVAAGGHLGDPYREDKDPCQNVRVPPSTGNNVTRRAKLDLGFHFVLLLYRGHEGPANIALPGYFKPAMRTMGEYIANFDTYEAQEAGGGEMHDVVVGARFVLSGLDFPAPAYSVYSGGSHSSLTGFHLARRVALDRMILASAEPDVTVALNGILKQSTAPAVFFRDFPPAERSGLGNDTCFVPPALPDCSALYPRTYPDCYYERTRLRTHYEDRHSLLASPEPHSHQEWIGCAGTSHVNYAQVLACLTPGSPECDYCTSPINSPPLTRKILIIANYDDPVAPAAGPRAYYRKWWEDTANWDWYCASNPCRRHRPTDLEIHLFQYTSTEGYRTLGCMYPNLHDAHGCTPNPDFAPGPWGYEDTLQRVKDCFLGIRDPGECPRSSRRLVPRQVRGIQLNRIRVRVQDPSGAPIPGATVTVADFPASTMYPDAPVVRRTGRSGRATLRVAVGWKTLNITAPGYQPLLDEHIYVVKRVGLRDATTGRRIREDREYGASSRFVRGRCANGALLDCDNTDADPLNDYDQSGVFVLTPAP